MSRVRLALHAAALRVRAVAGPILEASLAAALAWYAAHVLLGHSQPFFAPIAAVVALSTSHVQRARRSVQMVAGVLLGIGVAELLHPLLGNSTLALGVILAVTLVVAVAVGAGFFAEGMMFVNQAAASAILVVALHRAGTGSERAVDALVGGAAALLVGVLLFPADPLKLLWRAERGLLDTLAGLLEQPPPLDRREREAWEVRASHAVHRRLGELTGARGTAQALVRVAPRRMPLRAQVDGEEQRVSRMYLLGGGIVALVRSLADLQRDDPAAYAGCAREVQQLAAALRAARDAPRPWPPDGPAAVGAELDGLLHGPEPQVSSETAPVAAAVRRSARDLMDVLPAGG